MPADLDPVDLGADMVGVVDHPVRQPQEALFEGLQVSHAQGSKLRGSSHAVYDSIESETWQSFSISRGSIGDFFRDISFCDIFH